MKRTHRLAVVCWLAMVTSLVLLAFVAEMIATQNAPFRGMPAGPLRRERGDVEGGRLAAGGRHRA